MIYLIKVSSNSLTAKPGDVVERGHILGRNSRTLELMLSPVSGQVTDILQGSSQHSSTLVIESLEAIPAQREAVSAQI